MAVALTASPYQRAVGAIEAVSWRGMRPGLERTRALLRALGDPQHGLRGVLVGGTNGKGSVCALVDSALRAAGLRTIMLTKPHLESYRERIVVDGEWIDEDAFAQLIHIVASTAHGLPASLQPTGFEMMTAAGALAAARVESQAVVCEVGLGGRLDSTNVFDLGVAAITTVGLDHREHLGDTVEAIATEKAAIIKEGNAAVTAAEPPALDVIRERCTRVKATLLEVDPKRVPRTTLGSDGLMTTVRFNGEALDLRLGLIGGFQAVNAAVAAAVCDALRQQGMPLGARAVRAGFAQTSWPGRMQWVEGRPPVLVDGAHNPDGMAALVSALPELRQGRRLAVVFAVMRDKDVATMASILAGAEPDAVVVTAPAVTRALAPEELATALPGAVPAANAQLALGMARKMAGTDGLVVICGSLYLAGEALRELNGTHLDGGAAIAPQP